MQTIDELSFNIPIGNFWFTSMP